MDTSRIHAVVSARGGPLPAPLRAMAEMLDGLEDDTHGGVVEVAYSAPFDAVDRHGPDDDGLPTVDDRIAIVTAVLQSALAWVNSAEARASFYALEGEAPRFDGDDEPSSEPVDADLLALEALIYGDDDTAA